MMIAPVRHNKIAQPAPSGSQAAPTQPQPAQPEQKQNDPFAGMFGVE